MQVFRLQDHNPLLPYPGIADASMPAHLKQKKAKVAVEPLHVQAFDCAFDIPPVDPLGSPGRRQPWLSSVLFNHESKRRSFARSKLNHTVGYTQAAGNGMLLSPHTPRAQQNSPAVSRISTAGIGSVISLRSIAAEPKPACAPKPGHSEAEEKNAKEGASGSVSERSHRRLRLHFQDPRHHTIDSASGVTTCEPEVLLPVASFAESRERDLQISGSPTLSAYDSVRGRNVLVVQSKSAPLTPRAPGNSARQRSHPRVINLCDPVVPPLKLPSDDMRVSQATKDKDVVISERRLQFSIPNDTYYRIRGSQTQRLLRGYVPYPIAVANVAYPDNSCPMFPDASAGLFEPMAPSRSAKSIGSTPRSPVVLSRTVFLPAPQESPARVAQSSQPPSNAKDHVVTAEMQLKGILIEAGAVSATMFNPVIGNVAPLYSGAGPKVKSTGISDKVWSRTAKVAAAADK